jgi:hypothetical protein
VTGDRHAGFCGSRGLQCSRLPDPVDALGSTAMSTPLRSLSSLASLQLRGLYDDCDPALGGRRYCCATRPMNRLPYGGHVGGPAQGVVAIVRLRSRFPAVIYRVVRFLPAKKYPATSTSSRVRGCGRRL